VDHRDKRFFTTEVTEFTEEQSQGLTRRLERRVRGGTQGKFVAINYSVILCGLCVQIL
jgi:hypothetical protein